MDHSAMSSWGGKVLFPQHYNNQQETGKAEDRRQKEERAEEENWTKQDGGKSPNAFGQQCFAVGKCCESTEGFRTR